MAWGFGEVIFGFQFFNLFRITAPISGEDAAENAVDNGGDGAGCGCVGSEDSFVASGEMCPQAAILHADLNGDGAARGGIVSEGSGEEIAEAKGGGVEENDGYEQEVAFLAYDGSFLFHDGGDNEDDDKDGDKGAGGLHAGDGAGEGLLEAKAKEYREDDDGGVENEFPEVNGDKLAGIKLGEKWGHGDGGECGAHGHGHRESKIGAGEIGDEIGRSAAWAAGDEDEAGGELWV